jgi:drug/metabolite transporter (DMT)-like permease
MRRTQNTKAAGLALAASAILAFIDNFVGAVAQDAGLWQFQLTRSLFAIPLLLSVAYATGIAIWPKNWRRLAGRSIAVAVGLLVYFAALGSLPVAQAGAGLFSAPLWVALLSALLFRERLGVISIFAVLLGFVGALLLLQPDMSSLTALSMMPLAAGLFYGLGMMLTHFWCQDEGPITLALGVFVTMGLAAVLMLACVSIWPGDSFLTKGWAPPTWRFLGLTLFQAVGALFAVSLIAQAYRIGAPSVVAVFEYAFLIFASVFAFTLWGSPTNLVAWIGIAIIAVSGLLMATINKGKDDAALAL